MIRALARFALAILLMLVGRAASAQAAPARDTTSPRIDGITAILAGELALALERGADSAAASRITRASAAVARGYATVARSPALTAEFVARASSTHLVGDVASARPETLRRPDEQVYRLMLLQAAQGARLIEQNDRIIALLEAQAKR